MAKHKIELVPSGKIEVELVATKPKKLTLQQFADLRKELKEAIKSIRFEGEGAAYVDVKVK
jgi:hypothetical protein